MKIKIILLIQLLVGILVLGFLSIWLLETLTGEFDWTNQGLWSSIQALSAAIAISFAITFNHKRNKDEASGFHLIAMGLLIMALPRGISVINILSLDKTLFFQALANFIAGCFFFFSIVPEVKKHTTTNKLSLIIPTVCIFSILAATLLINDRLPMLENNELSHTYIIINLFAAFLFLASAGYFVIQFYKTQRINLYLVTMILCLLALSCIAFQNYIFWGAGWWFSNITYLLAYLVAASLIINRLFDLTSDINFLILENEKVQNALYLNKELTRLIIDSAYDPFVFIDTNGLITDWNTQAVKTFGWTREEVIGKDVASLILLPEQTQAELKLNFKNYLQGNSISFKNILASKVKSRTGHEFSIDIVIYPFKLANKIEFIVIFKPQIYSQPGKEQKDEIKLSWPRSRENDKGVDELQDKFKAGHILIVDDDDIIHSTLERILLEEDKYVIEHAYSGKEGLDKVNSDCNVVICDIRMPDMNGLEVLKEIRRRKINTEVFMITGYASPSSEIQAFNHGTTGYLTKPLANISELRSKIHKAVELSMKKAS